jgi:hypothetical protein
LEKEYRVLVVGAPGEKAVFLQSDHVFVRTMAWLSGWAGSKPLDAETFLLTLKAERVMMAPKDRGEEMAAARENTEATERLAYLWDAIDKYAVVHGGDFPRQPTDLTEHLHRGLQRPERGVPRGLRDPVTGLTYRLFPFKTLGEAQADPEGHIVAWTRGVGGPDGGAFMYLGNNEGKRPVLYADGKVRWEPHETVREALRAQARRLLGTAPAAK